MPKFLDCFASSEAHVNQCEHLSKQQSFWQTGLRFTIKHFTTNVTKKA